MRLTSADAWPLPAGRVLLLRPFPVDPGSPVALSVNQVNHLVAARAGEPSVWLALACEPDLPRDPLRLARVEAAVRTVAARHSSMRTSTHDAGRPTSARAPAALLHEGLDWRWVDHGRRDATQVATLVRDLLDRACRPARGRPAHAVVVVEPDRPVPHGSGSAVADRPVVVWAFDHVHADAVSLAVVLTELDAALTPGARVPAPAEVGCFASSAARWAAAPSVPADDPRLAGWHGFLARRGGALPTFPLPLGLVPGQRTAQRTPTAPLADAATTAAVAQRAARAGTTTFGAVLAAYAHAVRTLGGPDHLDLLVPVHTRGTGPDLRAVGWYTTTVPVVVPAGAGAPDLAGTGAALRTGLALADLPLDQVLASLPVPLRRERADVAMVSYLDYRRLPGREAARRLRARHVSAPTRADDLQAWVSRTDDGLALRVRHPATAVAEALVPRLVGAWSAALRALAPVGAGAGGP